MVSSKSSTEWHGMGKVSCQKGSLGSLQVLLIPFILCFQSIPLAIQSPHHCHINLCIPFLGVTHLWQLLSSKSNRHSLIL